MNENNRRIVKLDLKKFEPRFNHSTGEVEIALPIMNGPIFEPKFMQGLGEMMGEKKAEKLLDKAYTLIDEAMITAILKKAVVK